MLRLFASQCPICGSGPCAFTFHGDVLLWPCIIAPGLFGAKFGELGHVWHPAESLIDFVGHCEQCTPEALATLGLSSDVLFAL